jgi:RES domain-containing protein
MEVFRISREQYAHRLEASGNANRWNLSGQFVIYAGSSRSLSTLELVVHRGSIAPLDEYKVMVISVADEDHLYHQIPTRTLPANWRSFAAYFELQKMGAQWFREQTSLILKVPSAVIPYEFNYLINTEHPLFKEKVALVRTEEYFWDSRLLFS